jgi:hypothetical protein
MSQVSMVQRVLRARGRMSETMEATEEAIMALVLEMMFSKFPKKERIGRIDVVLTVLTTEIVGKSSDIPAE